MNRIVLIFFALCMSTTVQAQAWPAKPVRVIVNVAPGVVADLTMRVIGARLTEALAQPVIVENRPGGDSYIGFEAVIRAEHDGYTLIYAPGSTMMMAPHLVRRPDLDPLKAFVPVAATGSVSLYLVVNPKFPATNLNEFLAYARANPGRLNYGTPGNGTSPHIATEVFNREAAIKLSHVPYKGAGLALNALLGGSVEVLLDPGIALPQVKAGKLRMVAVAGGRRHPDYPEVPTLEKSGIKGVSTAAPTSASARRPARRLRPLTGSTARCKKSCRSRPYASALSRSRSVSPNR